jgi:hypothetical protein
MGLPRDLPDWDREVLGANDGDARRRGRYWHLSDTTGNAIRCNTGQAKAKKPP